MGEVLETEYKLGEKVYAIVAKEAKGKCPKCKNGIIVENGEGRMCHYYYCDYGKMRYKYILTEGKISYISFSGYASRYNFDTGEMISAKEKEIGLMYEKYTLDVTGGDNYGDIDCDKIFKKKKDAENKLIELENKY